MALAAFRRAVDVAVVLGFRSTPRNRSRGSLLLPRIAARAMACMTPGPFLQPGKSPVPKLALQRSTVQQSKRSASKRRAGATRNSMRGQLPFSRFWYYTSLCLIGCPSPPGRFLTSLPTWDLFSPLLCHKTCILQVTEPGSCRWCGDCGVLAKPDLALARWAECERPGGHVSEAMLSLDSDRGCERAGNGLMGKILGPWDGPRRWISLPSYFPLYSYFRGPFSNVQFSKPWPLRHLSSSFCRAFGAGLGQSISSRAPSRSRSCRGEQVGLPCWGYWASPGVVANVGFSRYPPEKPL